jgi:hypothetical protein
MWVTTGLYTDESPGLKVDPFVVMVLSIGFIISVVALHSESDHSGIRSADISLIDVQSSRSSPRDSRRRVWWYTGQMRF